MAKVTPGKAILMGFAGSLRNSGIEALDTFEKADPMIDEFLAQYPLPARGEAQADEWLMAFCGFVSGRSSTDGIDAAPSELEAVVLVNAFLGVLQEDVRLAFLLAAATAEEIAIAKEIAISNATAEG